MEDYAIRRREYVKQVRASFDQPTDEDYSFSQIDTEEETGESPILGLKNRLIIAVVLFCIILLCKYNSYSIFGLEVAEIIDMIRDNQYYTFLQKYVKM